MNNKNHLCGCAENNPCKSHKATFWESVTSPLCRCGHSESEHDQILGCMFYVEGQTGELSCDCPAYLEPLALEEDGFCICGHGRSTHVHWLAPVCAELDCPTACREFVEQERARAAAAATADITLAGLEEIASRGLTLELALLASLCVENSKAGERAEAKVLMERLLELQEFSGMKKFFEEQKPKEQTETDDGRYPLSLSD